MADESFYGADPLYGTDPLSGKPKTPINEDLAFRLRRVVSNAYGFVRGRETVASFSAITFEDLVQGQIDRLSGGTTTRPNAITRVKNIEKDLLSVAEQVKKTPPDAFLPADAKKDVNTPV